MTAHISQVVNVWRDTGGSTAEVIWDGSNLSSTEKWKCVKELDEPKKQISSYLLLEDGTRSYLPFIDGSAYLLPDRTGVVAIFEPGGYTKPDGTDHFPAPNNAAIFNADGSLRFQLRTDSVVHRIAAVHSGSMPPRFANFMGVLIASHENSPPEWVYAIDPDNPQLIPTYQWIRW